MHLTKYLHQQGSRVLLDEAILSTYTLRYFLSHREERQVVKPMKIHKIVKKNKFKTFPRLLVNKETNSTLLGYFYIGLSKCSIKHFVHTSFNPEKTCKTLVRTREHIHTSAYKGTELSG